MKVLAISARAIMLCFVPACFVFPLPCRCELAHSEVLAAVEAEAAMFQGGGVEDKPGASGGKCLGNGWGANSADFAEFAFTLSAFAKCDVGVRYAFDRAQYVRRFPANQGMHSLRAWLDGREIGAQINCPDTADWNVFTSVRISLGQIRAGKHILKLMPTAEDCDLNLDSISVVPASASLDTRAATFLPGQSRHFRVRLGPHVDANRIPARQVFANLEAQHTFLRNWLVFEPPRKGLLTILAADEWTTNASAYTTLGNIAMREREITVPGNNYAHEMFHFFEEDMGYATWWSEGMAYLSAFRSDTEVYGRRPEEMEADTRKLRAWWEQEGRKQMVRQDVNVLQWWGSDKLPADVGGSALYKAANLLLTDLWQQEGDDLFRRLYALLLADRAAGRYRIPTAGFAEKNRLLQAYVQHAAGHDLTAFWKKWGMAIP